MASDRMDLLGRSTELSALDVVLADVGADRHTLAVVRGAPGVGKSSLLTVAGNRWQRAGATVLPIRFSDAVPAWDLFGATATIAALREHFEQLDDPRLAELINLARMLCVPDSYRAAGGRSRLLIALAKMFGRLRNSGPVVVLADDIDAVPNPSLALAPACIPGYLVVAACRGDGGLTAAPAQLEQFADQLIDLGPLPADEVGPVVGQRIGTAADDSLIALLHSALGPLAQEPGTLLSTVDELRRSKRIVAVQGRACLIGSEPITIAGSHELAEQVRAIGEVGRDLVILAATSNGFGVDDLPMLAETTGQSLVTYGRAVDLLVAAGALDSSENGQLSCSCPALAERLRTEAPGGTVRLSRWRADQLIASEQQPQAMDAAAHCANVRTQYLSGNWDAALSSARLLTLTPSDPHHQLGSLLAAEICAAQGNLKQAASWLDTVSEETPFIALRGWVCSGLLAADGDVSAALAAGWWAYRQARDDDRQPGRHRLLARLAELATDSGHRQRGRKLLAELADDDRETLLFVRGTVTWNEQDLVAAAELARGRGHLPNLLRACLRLGELAEQPQTWLHEAHHIAKLLDAAPARSRARTLMRERDVTPPWADGSRNSLSKSELRIIGLIRDGRTNRQIALALRITEKTVEYYLSRLFAKTGCRSRVDLAAASARGQLAVSA